MKKDLGVAGVYGVEAQGMCELIPREHVPGAQVEVNSRLSQGLHSLAIQKRN